MDRRGIRIRSNPVMSALAPHTGQDVAEAPVLVFKNILRSIAASSSLQLEGSFGRKSLASSPLGSLCSVEREAHGSEGSPAARAFLGGTALSVGTLA